jgi:hypothetical protein
MFILEKTMKRLGEKLQVLYIFDSTRLSRSQLSAHRFI